MGFTDKTIEPRNKNYLIDKKWIKSHVRIGKLSEKLISMKRYLHVFRENTKKKNGREVVIY